MTSERRLLFGFDDIRAVTLECKNCRTRLTMAPDKIVPDQLLICPQCRATWIPAGMRVGRNDGFPVYQFLGLLGELIENAKPGADTRVGVRVLFEVNEPLNVRNRPCASNPYFPNPPAAITEASPTPVRSPCADHWPQ